ncbi:hypothetical protein QB607_003071 [Clostridium botulinum]|nr:hypothetical protein [Clostridium botulinum]EKS4395744.1 hypothetical protein [Clostridium botulinum]
MKEEQEIITKKYKFSVATNYVGSKYTDDNVEIEFTKEDYENEEKREEIIQEWYNEWVWQNIDCN